MTTELSESARFCHYGYKILELVPVYGQEG